LQHLEKITDVQFQPLPSPLGETAILPGTNAPLRDYITEPWEDVAQGYLQTNLQTHLYCPYVTSEVYQYIQCAIKKRVIKMYDTNILKKEHTTLRFPIFNSGDGVQKLMASMPDSKAHGEWEEHTLNNWR
jgi:transposase